MESYKAKLGEKNVVKANLLVILYSHIGGVTAMSISRNYVTGIYRIAIRIIHRGHALVEIHTELEDSVG